MLQSLRLNIVIALMQPLLLYRSSKYVFLKPFSCFMIIDGALSPRLTSRMNFARVLRDCARQTKGLGGFTSN